MLFGNKIKQLRDETGVLQRQLAALLEMETPMFSKIERGARFAKRSHVILLAEYFHIDAKEMLTLWLADPMLYAIKGEKETELSRKAFDIAKNATKVTKPSIINS